MFVLLDKLLSCMNREIDFGAAMHCIRHSLDVICAEWEIKHLWFLAVNFSIVTKIDGYFAHNLSLKSLVHEWFWIETCLAKQRANKLTKKEMARL